MLLSAAKNATLLSTDFCQCYPWYENKENVAILWCYRVGQRSGGSKILEKRLAGFSQSRISLLNHWGSLMTQNLMHKNNNLIIYAFDKDW